MEGKVVGKEKDKIVLHMFPRKWSKQVVNLSPFVIKLETWMRLKGINYEIKETTKLSKSTHTIPYIHLNGVEYADANFIIPMLAERYGLDPTEGLTPEQQGISRAYHKMLDENTVWTIGFYRAVHKPDEYAKFFQMDYPWPLNKAAKKYIKSNLKSRMDGHGIGRHTAEEIIRVGMEDIRALGQYLADKQFMFGDNMTLFDCVAFGQLGPVAYVALSYPYKDVFGEYPNLKPYLDRIKGRCWPDWDDLVDMNTFK